LDRSSRTRPAREESLIQLVADRDVGMASSIGSKLALCFFMSDRRKQFAMSRVLGKADPQQMLRLRILGVLRLGINVAPRGFYPASQLRTSLIRGPWSSTVFQNSTADVSVRPFLSRYQYQMYSSIAASYDHGRRSRRPGRINKKRRQ